MIRISVLFLISVATLSAQSWQQEGALKRWSGKAIVSTAIGCIGSDGNPIVDVGAGTAEVNLTSGALAEHDRGSNAALIFLPRAPMVWSALTHHNKDGAAGVTIAFSSAQTGSALSSVDADVNVEALTMDVADTWVTDDGTEGCVVFAPLPSTPDTLKEYVIISFRNATPTFVLRVKPKVDVDIYVQPNTDDGTVFFLRGNGISFPPSTEEVFTNGSYLRYDGSGRRTRLDLPTRGPGSGKGRSIIWSSTKWDRLLVTDEFASGALLVKATNGIVVDSITTSAVAPGESVKILSASGNNNDRWMATHASVGSKNVLILWAMPDTREVTSVEFGSSDVASKQMPLSPWSIVIPFISTSGNNHTLFSWNPQDVISVDEGDSENNGSTVYPLPATDYVTITAPTHDGDISFVVVSVTGERVLAGSATAVNGRFQLATASLPSGTYSVTTMLGNTAILQHNNIYITR